MNRTSLLTLLTLDMVSVGRTQKLMSSLGIPISKGKNQGALEIAAEKVKSALDLIKTMILMQFVLHFDETGVRVAGKLNWLHCACTDKWRLYSIEEKRGKTGKGKFRCLLERFRDFKEDILRFARDWRVPFTNNTAERAIRWAKVKDKVSGCFRSKAGANDFAAVLSFVSTAALHGLASFDALKSVFSGNAFQLVVDWDD